MHQDREERLLPDLSESLSSAGCMDQVPFTFTMLPTSLTWFSPSRMFYNVHLLLVLSTSKPNLELICSLSLEPDLLRRSIQGPSKTNQIRPNDPLPALRGYKNPPQLVLLFSPTISPLTLLPRKTLALWMSTLLFFPNFVRIAGMTSGSLLYSPNKTKERTTMFAAENCGCSQHFQNSVNAMIDEVKNSGRLLHVEGLDAPKFEKAVRRIACGPGVLIWKPYADNHFFFLPDYTILRNYVPKKTDVRRMAVLPLSLLLRSFHRPCTYLFQPNHRSRYVSSIMKVTFNTNMCEVETFHSLLRCRSPAVYKSRWNFTDNMLDVPKWTSGYLFASLLSDVYKVSLDQSSNSLPHITSAI